VPLHFFIFFDQASIFFINKKISIFILIHKLLMGSLFSASTSWLFSACASHVSLACRTLFLFCRIRCSWWFFTS